jgi:hypothetical protein
MVYTTTEEIRDMSGISTTDVTDVELMRILQRAQAKVNSDISQTIYEEPIYAIDNYRMNRIDGSNITYYVKNSYFWFLGDLDNDGELSVSDVQVWQYDLSSATKSQLTVLTIDERGSFTLSAAPSPGVRLTVTYRVCPVSINTPDILVKIATEELATAMARVHIDAGAYERITLRDLTIQKSPDSFKAGMDRYREIITQINDRWLACAVTSDKREVDLSLLQISDMDQRVDTGLNMDGLNLVK